MIIIEHIAFEIESLTRCRDLIEFDSKDDPIAVEREWSLIKLDPLTEARLTLELSKGETSSVEPREE